MLHEIKVEFQEADVAGKTIIGSFALAASGLAVAAADFVRYAGQDVLHSASPDAISSAHELFDAVGTYGLIGALASSVAVCGGALAGRIYDSRHSAQN